MNEDALYTVCWKNPTKYIVLDEYKIPLPRVPKYEKMENFGLPVEQQKFRRTKIPSSLLKRKLCNRQEEEFIRNEYHKIHNGVWMLIKGEAVYLTGPYYFFLNYWVTQKGSKPDFIYIQCQIFLFWEMCVRDPRCYGMLLVKPRRIGGTEISIAMIWLDAMRYFNMVCGMQSKNEDSVYKNYRRIIKSHKNMIWYMKPVTQGSTENKEGLFFKYPVESQTARKNKEIAESGHDAETVYEYKEIGSEITYQPSVATAYDGERLDRYILNEFGKIEKMDAMDCWDKVKPCLHLNNGMIISGKAIFESTIEQINDSQIESMNDFYRDSDVSCRDENGRTGTGLYRLFVNALDAASPDEYGFPKKEETRLFLEKQYEGLKRSGKIKELASLRRKTPLFIEEALTPSGSGSAFHKEKMQETLDKINRQAENATIRGDFMWQNGILDTTVIFVPNPDGRWEVSKLTGFEDNHVIDVFGERYPGNPSQFRSGTDPYSHKDTQDNRKSMAGSVMFEMYDENIDGDKWEITNTGLKIPHESGLHFKTNQPVAIYLYRHEDPDLFFEDMIMESVYYGAPKMVENNKPGMIQHFNRRKYSKFIMNKPASSQNNEVQGIAASDPSIEQYFNKISSYIYNYHNTIKFKRLILQLMNMNRSNIGKHDLGVAFGWCLIGVDKEFKDFGNLIIKQQQKLEWFSYSEY